MGNKIRHIGLMAMTTIGVALLLACAAPPATPAPSIKEPATPVRTTALPWEEKWNGILGAAKKEGKVTVYGTYGEVKEAVGKAFKNKFGMEVDFLTGGGAEISKKLLSERAANLYLADTVILGAPTALLTLKPQGVFVPMEPLVILPEALDPRAWPDGKIPYLDKERLAIPLTGAYRTFVLANTDLVKENDVKSYQDLIKPQWKDKMVLFDPTITGAANSWVAFILKIYGLEEGEKYLREIARQEPAILKDKRLQVEWVARAKYALGPGADATLGTEFFRAGAPVRWVYMQEGGLVHPSGTALGLVDKSPHPNAAIVFMNWLLSEEGQTVFSQGYGNPAVRRGITTEGLDPFMLPPKEGKVWYYDEEFSRLEGKGLEVAKSVFGPLMK